MYYLTKIAAGVTFALVGYLAPVMDIVVLFIVAMFIDFVTGIWASVKRGNVISSRRMWRSVYKMFYSLIIIVLIYAVDTEIGIEQIDMHRFAALLIIGCEIWSIIENAAEISDHPMFRVIKKYLGKRIEKETGIDLNEELKK